MARASEASICPIFACACGLRRICAVSMPGSRTSPEKSPRPVMSFSSSTRLIGAPKILFLEISFMAGAPSHFGRGVERGPNDVLITGAAAQTAGERLPYIRLGWRGVLRQEVDQRHQKSGRAIAT